MELNLKITKRTLDSGTEATEIELYSNGVYIGVYNLSKEEAETLFECVNDIKEIWNEK
jgi:hypothetical protein